MRLKNKQKGKKRDYEKSYVLESLNMTESYQELRKDFILKKGYKCIPVLVRALKQCYKETER